MTFEDLPLKILSSKHHIDVQDITINQVINLTAQEIIQCLYRDDINLLGIYLSTLQYRFSLFQMPLFTSNGPIILGPFDNANRTICFSTTALADVYFEGNQTFTYSLTLIGEQVPVMISPNVSMVTILDNTSKRSGGRGSPM